MYLKNISLINYKNFDSRSFEFNKKINCLVGKNGVGKTNVLDAIYYLSYTKGYFNSVASQNIRHGEDFFVLDGTYQMGDRDENISCSFKKGSKKVVKRNGKEYEKLSDHYGLIPLVIISPSDTNLIVEGSEMRRKFMDSIISLNDKDYLRSLLKYNKILSQRNSLLKYFAANFTFDSVNIEVYNEQLIQYGEELFEKRKLFIEKFMPIFKSRYAFIVKNMDKENFIEDVSLTYKTQLDDNDFKGLLDASIEKDRLVQYTSVGVHKDDLAFKINGYPIKKIGSQGQQKSFLIALKLAQFDFLKMQSEGKPILLLDDIFDKLDEDRVGQLIELVNASNFGQIFISDTHAQRTEALIKKTNQDYSMFEL
ncbi:MAG: DNA replication and repair protein RecF [Flavobacteriaceae bacterium]|nr:DNA replication and repair protein RecF [Flavobacteriaceae bacterium]